VNQGSALAIGLRSCGIDLEPGGRYRRLLIHDCVSGQRLGGISTPRSMPSILIFTGAPGKEFGYSDEWLDDTTFLYTGEGQRGDMEMIRGNRAVRDHTETGQGVASLRDRGQGIRALRRRDGMRGPRVAYTARRGGEGSKSCGVSSQAGRVVFEDDTRGVTGNDSQATRGPWCRRGDGAFSVWWQSGRKNVRV